MNRISRGYSYGFSLSLIKDGLLCCLFLTVLVGSPGVYAYHYPWDQGHDTTEPDYDDPPGPCNGPCENDPGNCASKGSPVYLATGGFIWNDTDVVLKGRPQISFSRTYNSNDPKMGMTGKAWSTSCSYTLEKSFFAFLETDGGTDYRDSYVRTLSNGKRYEYRYLNPDAFTAQGVFDRIVRQDDEGLIVHIERNDGSYDVFDFSESGGRGLGTKVSTVDRNGNALNYGYDDQRRITSIADENGRFLKFQYGGDGLLNFMTDHSGRIWEYQYDSYGNLVSVTNPEGGVRNYEYQAYTTSDSDQTYYQLTRVIDEAGVAETEVSYTGRKVYWYKDYEHKFTYSFNDAEVTKSDTFGSTWVYTLNSTGQYIQIDHPLNREELFDRYEDSLISQHTSMLGAVTDYIYNEYGHLKSLTDDRGQLTLTYEDEKPWPTSIQSKTGRLTSIEYDGNGNPTTLTDPGGNSYRMIWSLAGDLLEFRDPLGNRISIRYSSQGMPVSITDAIGRETLYEYDLLNNRIRMTNPAGEITQYGYDSMSRVVSITDANGDTTTITRDGVGKVLQINAPNEEKVSYAYDSYGRLNERTFYDGSVTSYTYRADNLLNTSVTPNGVTISYNYDAGKRLTQMSLSDGDVYTYSYNDLDQLISAANNIGNVSSVYDQFGRMLSETVNGETTSFVYNNEDELSQLVALGVSQSLEHDARGLITEITADPASYQYSYDGASRLVSWTRNSGQITTYVYDAANQLVSIDHGQTLRNYLYDFDDASRINQWQGNANETRTYEYDNVSRLTEVNSDTTSTMYVYDSLGNRLNDNAVFDVANRLIENDEFIFTYDVNGNRTEKISKLTGEVDKYSYNSLNQMINYKHYPDDAPETVADVDWSYEYGPLGRRWAKLNNLLTESVDFYWVKDRLIGELNGGVERRYVLYGSSPIAFIEDEDTFDYLADHMGTPHQVVDSLDSVVWQADYDSFGSVSNEAASRFNNLRFSGQYSDKENGIFYNYYRDYDPSLGRYLQSDPIGLRGGLNAYGYANSNPIMYSDPFGLEPNQACVAACTLGGGVMGGGLGYLGGGILGGGSGTLVAPGVGTLGGAIGGAEIGGAAGAAAGSAAGNIVGNAFCPDDDEGDNCDDLYATDTSTCNGITRVRGESAGAACHASASERYGACLAGRPIPPLNTWNN